MCWKYRYSWKYSTMCRKGGLQCSLIIIFYWQWLDFWSNSLSTVKSFTDIVFQLWCVHWKFLWNCVVITSLLSAHPRRQVQCIVCGPIVGENMSRQIMSVTKKYYGFWVWTLQWHLRFEHLRQSIDCCVNIKHLTRTAFPAELPLPQHFERVVVDCSQI